MDGDVGQMVSPDSEGSSTGGFAEVVVAGVADDEADVVGACEGEGCVYGGRGGDADGVGDVGAEDAAGGGGEEGITGLIGEEGGHD